MNSYLLSQAAKNFGEKWTACIISFKGYENKILTTILSKIKNNDGVTRCCFDILSRKEMIAFYKRGQKELFEQMIISIINFKYYNLINAWWKYFNEQFRGALKESYR